MKSLNIILMSLSKLSLFFSQFFPPISSMSMCVSMKEDVVNLSMQPSVGVHDI